MKQAVGLRLVLRHGSFVTYCRARVGRVTPCAPCSLGFVGGGQRSARPTMLRNLFVTILVLERRLRFPGGLGDLDEAHSSCPPARSPSAASWRQRQSVIACEDALMQ